MDVGVRQAVRQRANGDCEYCGLHEEDSPLARHQIKHIVPVKHGGSDDPENLALACIACNLDKGSNLSGLDPHTGELTSLFDPRQHTWQDHFRREALSIVGLTSIGRTTVVVLRLNSPAHLRLRLAEETS